MKVKIRAFTLIELILVLAIGSILLGISTNWYVTNIASANNKNNRQVDLQSSVSSSMDVIKNTLKKTSQIHLVGKNVYDPALSVEELNNTGLDVNYNYIALSKDKDTRNQTLVNIVYNKNLEGGKFEVFPLLAQERTDNLQSRNISYDMRFYKEDGNYRNKLDKNILNLTLIGNAHDVDENGQPVNSQNDILFQLSEDIYMQNINQILVSKHFEGGIDEVTAIAYDNQIVHGESVKNKVTKMSFVFAIDNSGSMTETLMGKPNDKYENSRKKVARDSIMTFIEDIHKKAKKSEIEIDAYIFIYGSNLMEGNNLNPSENNKYLFPKSNLPKYGPYKLGAGENDFDKKTENNNTQSKIEVHIDNTCKMKTMYHSSGTNTGWAILQSLELLNQLREENKNQRTFFILLTDGVPTQFTSKLDVSLRKNQGSNKDIMIGNYTFFGESRGFIKNANDYYNPIEQNFVIEGQNYRLTDNGNNELKTPYYIKGGKADCIDPNGNQISTSARSDVGYMLPMLYIKEVTSPEAKNNLPDTFDHAYIIGFSGVSDDKQMIGYNNKDYFFEYDKLNDFDYNGNGFRINAQLRQVFYKIEEKFKSNFSIKSRSELGSIRKYLAQEGTKFDKRKIVDIFDTDGSASLDKAFADIVQSIGDVTGAFDGPKKLRGR